MNHNAIAKLVHKRVNQIDREIASLQEKIYDLKNERQVLSDSLAEIFKPAPIELPLVTVDELKKLPKLDAVKKLKESRLGLLDTKKAIEATGWYDTSTNQPNPLIPSRIGG